MTTDLFTEDCRTHIHRVGRLSERRESPRLRKLEYLVAQCVGMADGVLSLGKDFSESGELQGFSTYHDAVESLLGFFSTAIGQCNIVKETVLKFQRAGQFVEHFDELADRIDLLQEAFDKAEATWPVLSFSRIERSRQEYDAGDVQTAKEIADELRRKGSPEHQAID
jgi:hypothetical protein